MDDAGAETGAAGTVVEEVAAFDVVVLAGFVDVVILKLEVEEGAVTYAEEEVVAFRLDVVLEEETDAEVDFWLDVELEAAT